jgi:hypothetical protein
VNEFGILKSYPLALKFQLDLVLHKVKILQMVLTLLEVLGSTLGFEF